MNNYGDTRHDIENNFKEGINNIISKASNSYYGDIKYDIENCVKEGASINLLKESLKFRIRFSEPFIVEYYIHRKSINKSIRQSSLIQYFLVNPDDFNDIEFISLTRSSLQPTHIKIENVTNIEDFNKNDLVKIINDICTAFIIDMKL